MDTKEFISLVERSGLKHAELGKLLGVGRQTIHNYLTGKKIPDTKAVFIREKLSKDSSKLKSMLNHDVDLTEESVLPFVVKNFDSLMEKKEFRDKVIVEAYSIAEQIIERKKKEYLNK